MSEAPTAAALRELIDYAESTAACLGFNLQVSQGVHDGDDDGLYRLLYAIETTRSFVKLGRAQQAYEYLQTALKASNA